MARVKLASKSYCNNCNDQLLKDDMAWVSETGSLVLCYACVEEVHNDFGPSGHCSHEYALRHLYKIAMELGATNPAGYLSAIEYEVGRLGAHWFCKADYCSNRNRYTSGYCGIHDVVLNKGQGVRIGGG